jgi:glycosyltransferase involved in cell wall biosynthesis
MTKDRQRQLLHDRGICVVIPTYNNDGTIAAVVKETLEECSDVIVVNDGSTDKTSSILQSIEGITIVEYAKNQGKGYALKCGFRRALEMGFSYAITLDGDGQHYP